MVKELRQLWDSLPNKLAVAVLLAAWWALFEYCGMAQLYWVPTASLFTFLHRALETAVTAETDDQIGLWMPWLFLILVVVRRQELTLVNPVRPSWIGVVLVAGALLVHLLAFIVQQVGLSAVAFLVGAFGLLGIVWGREWLHRGFFPFVILGFMIPTAHYLESATFQLRHISAATATWIGKTVLNLPLMRDGTMVSAINSKGIPIFQFDVVDACSGIRSLKVIILLTVIFGFLQFKSAGRRWILLALAPPLAVAGNVCRLVCTFAIGEAWGQQVATTWESKLGFLTFAVAVGGVVLCARLMREPDDSAGSELNGKPSPALPATSTLA